MFKIILRIIAFLTLYSMFLTVNAYANNYSITGMGFSLSIDLIMQLIVVSFIFKKLNCATHDAK